MQLEMPSPVGQGAGTRHTHAVILPPMNPSDVMGNPPVVLVSEPTSMTNRPQRRNSVEDPLEYLRRYDVVCVVDDSSSMEGALWYEARDALSGIADVAARYDADGVDIHFLNDPSVGKNMRTGSEVKRLFDRVTPQGITPTGEKLEELLLDYLIRLEQAKADSVNSGDPTALKKIKPVNFLVITDGQPTDDPESVIVQAAKRLDEGRFPLSQVGIQFVQIGSDPGAAESLRELDDELAKTHHVRDMVDTVPFSAEGSQLGTDTLVKILLGGINRRLDRRKTSTG